MMKYKRNKGIPCIFVLMLSIMLIVSMSGLTAFAEDVPESSDDQIVQEEMSAPEEVTEDLVLTEDETADEDLIVEEPEEEILQDDETVTAPKAKTKAANDGAKGEGDPAPGGSSTVIDSGSCGASLTYEIVHSGSRKTLEITGSGPMYDYAHGTSPFYGNDQFEDMFIYGSFNEEMTVGDYAFENCTSFTTQIWATFSPTKIGNYAYLNCTSLSDYYIKACTLSIGEGAFGNCVSIDEFHKYGDGEFCFEIIDNAMYDKEVKRLIAYPPANAATTCAIPDGVTRIGDYAFCNCKNLERIEVPASVTEIGAHAFEGVEAEIVMADGICLSSIGEGAFTDCSGMTGHLTLSDEITSIAADTFRGCAGLTGVTFPETLTEIGDGAFLGCTGLSSVTLPESLTTIGAGAFQGCENLTLPDGFPEGLLSIKENAFNGCAGLTSIELSEQLSVIEGYAFANCTGLTSVSIPEANPWLGDYAFANCTSLTDVALSENNINSVGNHVFEGCISLKNVTLPRGQRRDGGEAMFAGCTGLTSLHIPMFTEQGMIVPADFCSGCTNLKQVWLEADLAVIKTGAFNNCTSLTDVYFSGTLEQWNAVSIETDNDILANVTIHCTDPNDYIPFATVIITPTEHGSVTTTDTPAYGGRVRLRVNPEEGYHMSSLVVTDHAGRPLKTIWYQSGGSDFYKFDQYCVFSTVAAVFEPDTEGGGTEGNPRQITTDNYPTILYNGWYEVSGNVTIKSIIFVKGDAHLILDEEVTMNAGCGINVSEGNSLTISGSGALIAKPQTAGAAIGSGQQQNAGTIVINGGVVNATGHSGSAGIGAGSSGECGTVIINGGTVTAKGSTGAYGGSGEDLHYSSGAGIGGCMWGEGGIIVINGGIIHASGGKEAPGIGGGSGSGNIYDSDITIADGLKVTAKGAAAPALHADRVDACSANDVTIDTCSHDGEISLSSAGETSCAHCGLVASFPDFGAGTMSDPWQIGSAARWNLFAASVENGLVTNGKYFRLSGDISVTAMMGTQANPFAGTFDGDGHTLNFTAEDYAERTAPFAYTNGTEICNLHVTGSITGESRRAAGLIGENSGVSTVTNCRVSASISGVRLIGGFAYGTGDSLSITGCVFDGKITGNPDQSGCFVAWGTSGLSITDSIAAPQSGSDFTGGTFCYEGGGAPTLTNCYYMQAIGTEQGKQAHSVKAAKGVDISFGSGTKYNVSKITAYEPGVEYADVFYAGKEEQIALTMSDLSSQRKYYVASAGELTGSGTSYTLVMPDEDVVISTESEPTVSIKDAKVVLSAASFTYNTKVQKPTIKTIKGLTLKEGTDYTAAWSNASSKNAGTYTVTITGKGNYTGTTKATYKINTKAITPAVTLSASAYTYNGKVQKPTVTVKDGSTKLAASQYDVTYVSGRKNVGTYKVTVKMKGNYSGSKTVSFKINPKGTTLSKVTKAKKAATVKWKKQAAKMSTSRITGYQIQLATDSKFTKNKKVVNVKGYSKTSKKVTGLKGGKKYWVRIRTYKKVGSTTYYSPWSKTKTVTTGK